MRVSYGIFKEGATISLSFDEYNFDIIVEYQGDTISIPQHMLFHEELMEDSNSFLQLAIALFGIYSDAFTVSRTGDINQAHIHFEH
jgi:hypothetical protein